MNQDSDTERLLGSLTAAERTVFLAALGGDSVKAVAHRLSLSQATVRSHLSAIYGKLQVDSRAHLIARFGHPSADVPPARAPRPPVGRSVARFVAIAGAVGALALVSVAAYMTATAPDPVAFEDLARQVRDGTVSELRYHDSTLIAETPTGEIAASNIEIEEAIRLSVSQSITLSTTPYEPEWLGNVVPVLPAAVVGLGLGGVLGSWLYLRRRHLRS
jgi:DNA-binding CsgD family transcriptional regulator